MSTHRRSHVNLIPAIRPRLIPSLIDSNRLKLLRVILSVSFLAGILLSHELWYPSARSFPRSPILFALPDSTVVLVERLLGAIFMAALMLTTFVRRSKIFSVIAIASACLLIVFDQMRLQPWVYQYLLVLTVIALHDGKQNANASSNHALGQLQLLVASLYIWSGVQKLNLSFSVEILPEFVAPVQSVLNFLHLPLVALGLIMALAEALIGFGLLFPRSRSVSVWLAVAMHMLILGLLITRGYNSVVWPWNAALMFIVIAVFWRSTESAWPTLTHWKSGKIRSRLAQSLTVAAALLPILSFWGWWDMSLSGALYSGNTEVAVVFIDQETYERLPRAAQLQVLKTTRDSKQFLPLFEWSMAELNVPPYPETRVFRQVARQVCKLTKAKSEVELVVKARPAILDGSYRVTQTTCAELER
jgi:hypothetical protein